MSKEAEKAEEQRLSEIKIEIQTSLATIEKLGIREIPLLDSAYTAIATIANDPLSFSFEEYTEPLSQIYGEKLHEFLSKGDTVFIFKLPVTRLIPDTDRSNFGESINFLTVVFEGGPNDQIKLGPIFTYNWTWHSPTKRYDLKPENVNGKMVLVPLYDLSTHPFADITNTWLNELTDYANTNGLFDPYFVANHNPKGLFYIETSLEGWPWKSKERYHEDSLTGHILFLRDYLLGDKRS